MSSALFRRKSFSSFEEIQRKNTKVKSVERSEKKSLKKSLLVKVLKKNFKNERKRILEEKIAKFRTKESEIKSTEPIKRSKSLNLSNSRTKRLKIDRQDENKFSQNCFTSILQRFKPKNTDNRGKLVK